MKKTTSAKLFQRRLLAWFDQYGRQHLPWQQNKTPYRVWVSEIMLQQTQVNTVIPYFQRFMQHLPNLKTLANAHEDEVLHLWSGLGYYSRARNLHRAAKIIVNTYQGHFPNTLDAIQQLPGIGRSTAGAIMAIAFKQPATILDGNVKRVLSRFEGILLPINDKKTENQLWELATALTPNDRVADYTQAMMDLGATICTRSLPKCASCPLAFACCAHQHNLTALIPAKKPKRPLAIREVTLLIVKKGREVWLHKRPSRGIWGGLFSLPEIPGKVSVEKIKLFCLEKLQISITNHQYLDSFRHTFTHYHLEIFPVILTGSKVIKKTADATRIWYKLNKPDMIGLPKPIVSILKSLT